MKDQLVPNPNHLVRGVWFLVFLLAILALAFMVSGLLFWTAKVLFVVGLLLVANRFLKSRGLSSGWEYLVLAFLGLAAWKSMGWLLDAFDNLIYFVVLAGAIYIAWHLSGKFVDSRRSR